MHKREKVGADLGLPQAQRSPVLPSNMWNDQLDALQEEADTRGNNKKKLIHE